MSYHLENSGLKTLLFQCESIDAPVSFSTKKKQKRLKLNVIDMLDSYLSPGHLHHVSMSPFIWVSFPYHYPRPISPTTQWNFHRECNNGERFSSGFCPRNQIHQLETHTPLEWCCPVQVSCTLERVQSRRLCLYKCLDKHSQYNMVSELLRHAARKG